jgi:O-methyltransferase
LKKRTGKGAGGHGYFICQALDRYPNMKGILLDLPSVVEGAKCAICEKNMDHRCTPVAGSFFEYIPSGADAYFMQHILHAQDNPWVNLKIDPYRRAQCKKRGRRVSMGGGEGIP